MRVRDVNPFGQEPWGAMSLFGLMLLFAFLGSKAAWYDHLALDRQVEFWVNFGVAAGTLLLAMFTAQSVQETKEVLRGEDRRHQQGFAPFVTLGDHFNNNEDYQPGFTAHNIGKGVALDVQIRIDGEVTIEYYNFPVEWNPFMSVKVPGQPSREEQEQAEREREKYKVVQSLLISGNYFCSSLWDGGINYFVQHVFADNYPTIKQVRYTKVHVTYQDMFGNPYRTVYVDSELKKYRWEQPRSLRPEPFSELV